MTIADKLEGLLPENGPVTDDERVIAEAVAELQFTKAMLDGYAQAGAVRPNPLSYLPANATWKLANLDILSRDGSVIIRASRKFVVQVAALAFAAGCIASAIYVVLV